MVRTCARGQANRHIADCGSGHTRTAGRTIIVLDASIVVELLTNGFLADAITHELAECDESFIVPHLVDVEVVSAVLYGGSRRAHEGWTLTAADRCSRGSPPCRLSGTRT